MFCDSNFSNFTSHWSVPSLVQALLCLWIVPLFLLPPSFHSWFYSEHYHMNNYCLWHTQLKNPPFWFSHSTKLSPHNNTELKGINFSLNWTRIAKQDALQIEESAHQVRSNVGFWWKGKIEVPEEKWFEATRPTLDTKFGNRLTNAQLLLQFHV